MADRIKGITVEINGDTTKLQNALKAVNGSLRESKTALSDVNKLLKMDPGNVTLLQQKQELLTKSIDATKEKLNTEREALAQLKNADQTDEVIKQQQALEREIVETEQKLKSLEKEYKNFGTVAAQQAKAVGDKMQDVGSKISSAGQGIATVGAGMTATITAPLTAVGKDAVENFGNVDKTLRLVQQTMGSTDDEAAMLSQAIQDAASKSVFSMQEAADATLNFARQGYTAKEAADMIGPAMALAAGTETELAIVTAGLGDTLKVFASQGMTAQETVDVLAKASAQADTDVTKLFDAMGNASSIFKTAGWSVKDLAAYTDVMGDEFTSGAEAANSMKTGLARLIDVPTKGKAPEWIERLNIDVKDGTGNIKSMIDVQKELHDSFAGLTKAEQMEAASALFGKNQMAKWLAFINTAPEKVQKYRYALDDVTGSASAMSDALMQGTGGAMEQLASTFDVTKYNIGEQLGEQITPLITELTELLAQFNAMEDAEKKQIVKALEIAAAIGPVLTIIGTLIMFIGGVINGIGTIVSAAPAIASFIGTVTGGIESIIAILSGPLGLALGALAASVWYAKTRIEECGMTWADVVDGFKFLGQDLSNFFAELWDDITWYFGDLVNKAATWGSDMIQNFMNGISSKWQALKDKIHSLADLIASYIHFSEPDVGPLSDFHTYMPDMMSELANGINRNMGMLDRPMNNLASALVPNSGINDRLDGIKGAIGGINTNTNVNVTLQGDAAGIFNMVKTQNNIAKKVNGKSAFA